MIEVQHITGGLDVQPTAVIPYRRRQASACLVNARRQYYVPNKTKDWVRFDANYIQPLTIAVVNEFPAKITEIVVMVFINVLSNFPERIKWLISGCVATKHKEFC